MRNISIFLFCSFLSLLAGCNSPSDQPEIAKTNKPATQPGSIQKVVLISIDTMRADALGFYPRELNWKTTPHLDHFAAENVTFLHATAQSATTAPSHKSIFYSVYPSVHKTTIRSVPKEKLKSPMQILQENGFKTVAFTGGGQVSKTFGFNIGFDSYWEATGTQKYRVSKLLDQASDWLNENYNTRFFLFLHTFEMHCPYDPPEKYFKKWSLPYETNRILIGRCEPEYYIRRRLTSKNNLFLQSLYAAEANYVDDFIKRLFNRLKELGIYDQTLIVFLSDHGESLGERFYVGHNQLYDIQLHTPMILHIPGIGAKRIDSPVELIDVMPTIFEILGVKRTSFPFQGKNLMPIIEGKERIEKRVLISEEAGRARVRMDNMALHFSEGAKIADELYDLKQDPDELVNLASKNAGLVQELKQIYKKAIHESRKLSDQFVLDGSSKPVISPEIQEELKALGYVTE